MIFALLLAAWSVELAPNSKESEALVCMRTGEHLECVDLQAFLSALEEVKRKQAEHEARREGWMQKRYEL